MGAVLLTGATGLVGSELLPRLVRRRPEARVVCLIRARNAAELDARRQWLIGWAGLDASESARVEALAGDVRAPDLGIGDAYARLATRVDEIFHAAASTRFDLDLETARRANVAGGEHVIRFAEAAARDGSGLRRLHCLSTAFSGGRPTISGEAEGTALAFRNTYEQSKWELEQRLEDCKGHLPVTCYRPSIVMGDSRTGRTLHFRVIYEPIKWVYLGLTQYVPVSPDLRFDIVPSDYVCDAMLALADLPDTAGRSYLLTAGGERAISVAEMIRIAVDTGNAYHAEIGRGPTPEPELLSPEVLRSAPGEERERLERIFREATEVIRAYAPYMLEEQLFDDPETRAALEGTGVACAPARDYFGRLVRYALETRFGELDAAARTSVTPGRSDPRERDS